MNFKRYSYFKKFYCQSLILQEEKNKYSFNANEAEGLNAPLEQGIITADNKHQQQQQQFRTSALQQLHPSHTDQSGKPKTCRT